MIDLTYFRLFIILLFLGVAAYSDRKTGKVNFWLIILPVIIGVIFNYIEFGLISLVNEIILLILLTIMYFLFKKHNTLDIGWIDGLVMIMVSIVSPTTNILGGYFFVYCIFNLVIILIISKCNFYKVYRLVPYFFISYVITIIIIEVYKFIC
jgi:hypothetical protein